MKKIKESTILILLFWLLVASGCANIEEVPEKDTIFETETAIEVEKEETTNLDESEQTDAEAKRSSTAATETESVESETETNEIETTVEELETETGETETTAEEIEAVTDEVEKIEYEVTPMEEVSMYASKAVNVRQGPSTDFDRLGALKLGQEVKVTGQASTRWYEIAYGEEKAYVSNKYLQNEPVPVEQIQQASQVNTAVPATSNIILIGDSRTAEMKNCVGENSCIWIAEYSTGIKWFVSDAVPAADPYIAPGTKVVINLGANDPQKVDIYIYTINEAAANWTSRGATVYYAAVGPCYQNPYHTNDDAVNFNATLQSGLSGVHWIDLYSHMVNNGFATRENDGFHYDAPTYASMYSYYMKCIK